MAMFLVFIRQSGPKWDSSSPLEAQSDWSVHAEFMDGLVEAGFIVLGGPIAGQRVVHVIEAESQEEIRSTLAAILGAAAISKSTPSSRGTFGSTDAALRGRLRSRNSQTAI